MTDHVWSRFALAPLKWLNRAVRGAGPERAALAQAVKAALAAVLAWLAAAELFELPQPFLAPWAAVFIVEATVYRSLRSAGQQVAAVGVAVSLAAVVDAVVPWQVLGMAIAVLTGLLIGQGRWFGDSGPWIGITALLLITWGTVTQSALLVDRLIETVLGVSIGLAVNALVFPPVYGARAQQATRRLASDMAELLEEMAEALRGDLSSDEADNWASRASSALVLVRQAEHSIELNRESRRLNLRQSVFVFRTPYDERRAILCGLRDAWPHIAEIAQTLRTTTGRVDPFDAPDRPSREAFATLLDRMASVVRLRAEGQGSRAEFESVLAETREALDDISDRLRDTYSFGLAGMVLPARHALRELTAA
ncbi:FUSC family protein [Kibdelosporangium aridum]|uniref:FUSC family protein n=1 Tax=Kibdelosporangium aridum TaxID=2030 RepID=UPI00068B737D